MNKEILHPKEIHFYTNLADDRCCSENDLDEMNVDIYSTKKAIDNRENVIRTTQICFLRDAWNYIDNGYDVYIHISDRMLKVEEHMSGTIDGKDVVRLLDLSKLLLGGVFGDYTD